MQYLARYICHIARINVHFLHIQMFQIIKIYQILNNLVMLTVGINHSTSCTLSNIYTDTFVVIK